MAAERRCAYHSRRPALSRCVACDKPVCRDCIVQTRIGLKCPSCAAGTASASPPRGRSSLRPPAAPDRPRRRSWSRLAMPLGVAGLVGLLGVAAFLAIRRPPPDLTGPGRESSVGAVGAVEAVEFRGRDGATLRGDVDLPRGDRSYRGPAAVVVPGFGPTTRDGVDPPTAPLDPIYADLGRILADGGMAVLRYDKRGTGQSAPIDPPALEFDDYVGDAAAAAGYLRARAGVDPGRLVLIGHDEGGLVALRLASQLSPPPAAVVLVSTPGRPLVEVVAGEIQRGGLSDSAGESEALAAEFRAAVATLVRTGEVPEVSEPLLAVLPADKPRYLGGLYSLEPSALAGGVEVPVLLVHGERDPGIRREDVRGLQAALASAPVVDVVHAPRADHTLRLEGVGPDHMGAAGPGTAGVAPDRDVDALLRISAWLRSVTLGEGASPRA